jgi:hypothetical protein
MLLYFYIKTIFNPCLQEYANDNVYFRPMVTQVLHYYYEEDLLEQETILSWHKKSSLYEAGAEIRKLVKCNYYFTVDTLNYLIQFDYCIQNTGY